MRTYDVLIIGGGVIGSSIAFELAAEKLRVVVLDRRKPGHEASWAAAGMLSPAPDSPRDIPLVPLKRQSLNLYPNFVAAIEAASGRPTGYAREGTVEVCSGPRGEEARDRRIADCRRLAVAAEAISIESVRDREASVAPAAQSAVWLPEEGTVEPRLLMEAILAAAENRGVEFRPNCAVTGLVSARDRCIGVRASGEMVSAGHIVVAAGCFSGQIGRGSGELAHYAPTRPVRGQMVELRSNSARPKSVLRSARGYVVPRRDGRIVAGSTSEEAGFAKRVTPAGIRSVLDHAIELIPNLADAEIVEMWSGLRPGTPDDLPILGPTDVEGLLIATGHYRNGILLAAVTARIFRELFTTRRTTLGIDAFSPLRFSRSELQAQAAT